MKRQDHGKTGPAGDRQGGQVAGSRRHEAFKRRRTLSPRAPIPPHYAEQARRVPILRHSRPCLLRHQRPWRNRRRSTAASPTTSDGAPHTPQGRGPRRRAAFDIIRSKNIKNTLFILKVVLNTM